MESQMLIQIQRRRFTSTDLEHWINI